MAILTCKMCGGPLDVQEGMQTVQCAYCDCVQTVPRIDDELKLMLFQRATALRLACDFDQASIVFQSIAAQFPEEAEAYWGLCLCEYGIEYVDDPNSMRKIPTCHRTRNQSILNNKNFLAACEYGLRWKYEEEARQIDEIQKKILSISKDQASYDIFLCYKETDDTTRIRTEDSITAQDIYTELIKLGYRVFFSRVTLRGKAGSEYEPYIYSALSSAKVMLVLGSKKEYFNAVWLKNEWSRFLSMMDGAEKFLIPCYENMEPTELPAALRGFQGLDMGSKLFSSDLLASIRDKVSPPRPESAAAPVSAAAPADAISTNAMLQAAQLHLGNKKWKNAIDCCDKALVYAPQNAALYIYKLAAQMEVSSIEDLANCIQPISNHLLMRSALRYADPVTAQKLRAWCAQNEQINRQSEARFLKARANAAKASRLLSAGKNHTVALKPDGTVISCGSNDKGQRNVSGWRDIQAVFCGANYTIGLKNDGTLVSCGDNEFGQCNVSGWTDIVSVACYENHTVGIRSDGTVLACGKTANHKTEIKEWREIRSIACGYHHTAGLREDHTVVCTGSDKFGQCDTADWTDIVSVYAKNVQTLGVRRNGTVASCGCADDGRLEVKKWTDIVMLAPGTHHTLGLRLDGTVVHCGDDSDSRSTGTKDWDNIICIVSGHWHSLGIRSDGTVVGCGDTDSGKLNISGWKLFDNIDNLEQERSEATLWRVAIDQENAARSVQNRQRQKIISSLIDGGEIHTVALNLDGTVRYCGGNDKGQTGVELWRSVKAISCGSRYTMGLRDDGTVLACGNNEFGQCSTESWKDIVSISAGYNHSAAVRSDGTVVACGKNNYGQCNVGEWKDIKAVACGSVHTVGLRADGTVLVCGDNGYGQMNVSGWTDIVMICARNCMTYGLRSDGTVLATGLNEDGQCNLSEWHNITAIDCGSHHVVGLRNDGTVVACGHDGKGRSSAVSEWKDIIAIRCGYWTTFGIRSDGTIVSCGDSADKQRDTNGWKLFTNPDTIPEDQAKAIAARKPKDIREANERSSAIRRHALSSSMLSSGEVHAVGIRPDGSFLSCGTNDKGQLNIANWSNLVSVQCAGKFTVGLKNDGTVVACGDNEHGQCKVSEWRNIASIACGYNHTVGIRRDGTVVACGMNNDGQCDLQDWTDIVRVACGWHFTVGLKRNGTVVCKGNTSNNIMDVCTWSNIVAIAACNTHAVGLRSNGTVVAAGNNEKGQCNVEKWSDVIGIACGSHHTAALRANGTVVACGLNTNQRCSAVSNWSKVVGIACGAWTTFGILANGTILSCGDEAENQRKVDNWMLFQNVDTIQQEIQAAIRCRADRPRLRGRLASIASSGPMIALDDGRVFYDNSWANYGNQPGYWTDIVAVASSFHAVGLRRNGTVAAAGRNGFGQCNVAYWKNIVAVAVGEHHTVGLRSDGTVIACGSNAKHQCEVQFWRDVISIGCGSEYTIGLKKDGTIVACGDNQSAYGNLLRVNQFVRIVAGEREAYGITANGNCFCGSNARILSKKKVVDISSEYFHTVLLYEDGTVEAICWNEYGNDNGQCNVSGFKDICAVVAGFEFTLGLRKDGSLEFTGSDRSLPHGIRNLRGIMAMTYQPWNISLLLLDSGGTVYSTNTEYTENYSVHRVFQGYDSLLKPRQVQIPTDPNQQYAIDMQMEQLRRVRRSQGVCLMCGGEVKGLFGKKCAICGTKAE